MAGHSQFKNIMYRKGAQDKKRARTFAKIAREITAAAAAGNPDANPRLRAAISAARAANMPKDNINRALKRAADRDSASLEEIRYEAYGPAGVALIIETLTDNRNRTSAALRVLLSKNGGSLGETNSVAFLFRRVARLELPRENLEDDQALELALQINAQDCRQENDLHIITAAPEDLAAVRDSLAELTGHDISARLAWQPDTKQTLRKPEDARSLLALLDGLDDNEDVQHVYANFDVPAALLESLAAETGAAA
ncbi:MAG: YebC/PmpR family DNA-binding transcriptional regulator [Alphaproteobacteria bacterium]|nr:YebC/PmpR family DNA-binding transcriptional regulator [Alphaproteobacteria bacterium]